tara:strand:+ start:68 stop:910 length:843 start_codon:yes stop_codon:yes gene_type:complete
MSEQKQSIIDIAKGFEGGQPKNPDAPRNPMKSNVPEQTLVQDQLNGLLENIDTNKMWVEFNLPSKGKPYVNYEKDSIFLRAMKFSDEKRLQKALVGDRSKDALNVVLAGCVKGIDYGQLTLPDKLYVMFKIRQLSYGKDYPINTTCKGCGTKNELIYDLTKMSLDFMDETYQEHCTVDLPDSKKTAYISPIRAKHEESLPSPERIMEALPSFITRIDNVSEEMVIKRFLEQTTIKDVNTLKSAIFNPKYGMDQAHKYNCDFCNVQNDVNIGLNENFFTTS